MKENKLQFTTMATFSNFESTLNPSFHKARLRIMALDSVARNGVKFTHDGTVKALPTLKNVPLVTQYDYNTKNLKSHEFEDDGNALTYGIGVIAESCQQWIEEVEVEGEVKEYLCSEVLLWKRQKREYDFIKRHKDLNVSMEVMMNNPKKVKDGSIEVGNFYFTAVTVLGVGVNPAFGEANLVFAKDDTYEQMMFELNEFENGGSNMPQEGQTQVQEPVVNEGQEPQTVEPKQVVEPVQQTEPKVEPKAKEPEVDYKAKLEQLEAEMSRTIVDLTKERDGLVKQLQEAQDNAKAQVETLQSELADLKQFKAQIEKDKLDTERQAILDQFTDLQEFDEYKELIENLGDMQPSALEDKLYIIAGRKARENQKNKKQVTKPKLNISTPSEPTTGMESNPFAKFFM